MGRSSDSTSRAVTDAPAPNGARLSVRDALGRPIGNLRLSLIDRCNLRCGYCMPEEHYEWLPRADILSVDEITRVVEIFAGLGVDRVRLTGGEPLLRREVTEVVDRVASDGRIADLGMTTNGVLLPRHAAGLRRAGLDRATISLDSLRADRYRRLTGRDRLADARAGVEAALDAGLCPVKINTVIMRGFNDDEFADLLDYGRETGAEVRFIEYMDVGGATRWSLDRVVSRREMLRRLEDQFGPIEPVAENGPAPADRYRLPDGTTFGIIASVSEPFCRTCDRSRVTADGMWFLCLYAARGVDLRTPLRAGASNAELRALIVDRWTARADRGAEERRSMGHRGPLYRIDDLRADPHREMHTRGG